MNCQYKLEKYRFKTNQSNTDKKYKMKYNFYKNLVGGFTSLEKRYIDALNQFILEHNQRNFNDISKQIDQSHGLAHALMVLCHVENAIQAYNNIHSSDPIPEEDTIKVKLAALLHDVDDSKYFPENMNYENARLILSGLLPEQNINDVIQLIGWVSASKNGDNIPEECIDKPWLLYPRYADRLEALGIIGLERTLDYTLHKGQPLYIPEDSVAKPTYTIDDIYREKATLERYQNYKGKSKSMMDHFYDKLLLLGKYPIRNSYFDSECEIRQAPLEAIALQYEQSGRITEGEVREYIEKNKQIGTSCSCDRDVVYFMEQNKYLA
jgi:uncharacterized protein